MDVIKVKNINLCIGTRTLQLHSRVYTILRKSTRFDFSKCMSVGKTRIRLANKDRGIAIN